jgi:hypothetical protein
MPNVPNMSKYEVRVTHSYTNYYHIEAKNEEEEKASLINKGMHLIFSSEEIENCAGKIARSRFEDLSQ